MGQAFKGRWSHRDPRQEVFLQPVSGRFNIQLPGSPKPNNLPLDFRLTTAQGNSKSLGVQSETVCRLNPRLKLFVEKRCAFLTLVFLALPILPPTSATTVPHQSIGDCAKLSPADPELISSPLNLVHQLLGPAWHTVVEVVRPSNPRSRWPFRTSTTTPAPLGINESPVLHRYIRENTLR